MPSVQVNQAVCWTSPTRRNQGGLSLLLKSERWPWATSYGQQRHQESLNLNGARQWGKAWMPTHWSTSWPSPRPGGSGWQPPSTLLELGLERALIDEVLAVVGTTRNSVLGRAKAP